MTSLAEWLTDEIAQHPFINWESNHCYALGAPTWRGKLRTLEDMKRTKICTTVHVDHMTKIETRCPSYGRSFVAWDLIVWRDHRAHAEKNEAVGWSRCPECNKRIEREQGAWAERQEELHDYAAKERSERKQLASIPERYADKTFQTWQSTTDQQKQACEAAWHYADRFKTAARKTGRCMLLTGNMGTGKTHLSCAIAHEILSRGMSVIYTTAMEMLDRLRSTYDTKSRSETKNEALAAFADADLLIIDELGMSWGTDSERVELFGIFNARYNTKKPTLISCNVAPEEVRVILGERIYDRITEQGCDLIRFDWQSMRSA